MDISVGGGDVELQVARCLENHSTFPSPGNTVGTEQHGAEKRHPIPRIRSTRTYSSLCDREGLADKEPLSTSSNAVFEELTMHDPDMDYAHNLTSLFETLRKKYNLVSLTASQNPLECRRNQFLDPQAVSINEEEPTPLQLQAVRPFVSPDFIASMY